MVEGKVTWEADQIFSWVVTLVGCFGFWLGGKKIWWSWYVNIANQIAWVIFAVITGYYAFLIGTAVYSVVFVRNAYLWTRDHFASKRPNPTNYCMGTTAGDGWLSPSCNISRIPHEPHEIPEEDQDWDFNTYRISVPDVEIYDGDIPTEEITKQSPSIHPKAPKYEDFDELKPAEVLCTGRPFHPLCDMPRLAHKPHIIQLPDLPG